jgi:hypothetical protein
LQAQRPGYSAGTALALTFGKIRDEAGCVEARRHREVP